MGNVFWFHCISGIGLAIMIFAFYKGKAVAHLFSSFLAIASAAYLIEVVVLFVFRAYDYMPRLYSDPIADSIFGHLVCNGFFWGGFTLLTAALSLRFYWIVLFSALFMLVEVFFLKYNLYVHHWWKTYYTGIGVVVFLLLCKRWLVALRLKRTKLLRRVTFFFIAWILLAGPAIVLLITGSQHFESGLSQNYYLNDIYFDVPYHLVLSLLLVILINYLGKPVFKSAAFFLTIIGDAGLSFNGILSFGNGWNLFYLAVLRFLVIALYMTLEKNTLTSDDNLPTGLPAF